MSRCFTAVRCAWSMLMLIGVVAGDEPFISQMHLPDDVRALYRNPDGSCVQCSLGMCGAHGGDAAAAYLLEPFEGHPAERGGAWPSRVTDYCNRRGIEAWNVTSQDPHRTIAWARWAAKTGRFAAIGLNAAHFQTVYGFDSHSDQPWRVCDNNAVSRIARYGEEEFLRRHIASGPWVVVLKRPAPDRPRPLPWWQ